MAKVKMRTQENSQIIRGKEIVLNYIDFFVETPVCIKVSMYSFLFSLWILSWSVQR